MKVQHIPNSMIPKILGVTAITLYPFVLYSTPDIVPIVYVHEMVHVEQIQRDGVIKFYLNYLYQYCKNRAKGMNHDQAYRQIPYEIEAYKKQRGGV